MSNKVCKIDGCDKPSRSFGYCEKHYYRIRRHGSPFALKKKQCNPNIKKYPKEYDSWRSMRVRCTNKGNWHYQYYGAKGVTICERWLEPVVGFDNFLEDMGPSYGMTIDRIDPAGNYCPENCRWADRATQSRNRGRYKNGIYIEYNGETHSLTGWSKIVGVSNTELQRRYHAGVRPPELFKKTKRRIYNKGMNNKLERRQP